MNFKHFIDVSALLVLWGDFTGSPPPSLLFVLSSSPARTGCTEHAQTKRVCTRAPVWAACSGPVDYTDCPLLPSFWREVKYCEPGGDQTGWNKCVLRSGLLAMIHLN